MGYVYVRQGKCYIAYRRPDGRWVRESSGTDKKTLAKARYVPINSRMVELLKELKLDAISEYVFANPGSDRAMKSVENAWRKALRTAKVTSFRFHDLRHTFASRLVQTGSDVQHVKDLLGHKNITTTERYAHLRPVDLREAVEKLPTQPGEEKKTTPKDGVEKPKPKEEEGK